jgi:hypothetical protein
VEEDRTIKRRVCSYDMFAVPDPSFVLQDSGGEMYFFNLRCFCVWSVGLATRPNLSDEVKTDAYSLTTLSGEQHGFWGAMEQPTGLRPRRPFGKTLFRDQGPRP